MLKTPSGANSAKATAGRTWKRHLRMEKVVRLTALGLYSNEQIANSLGVVPQTIIAIRATPEFQAKMVEIATGVISEHDKELRENAENQRSELKSMVPTALLQLRSAALSRNENIALRASLEILDRDGTLAKVSKVSVEHKEKPDLDGINSTASSIMQLLAGVSGGAISQIDAISAFTVSAASATQQVKEMSELVTEDVLANLDLSRTKPQ